MEKNHLDKIVKNALEDFEVEYNPADWKAMEQRLEVEDFTDMPEMEDVLVDAISYSSLENLEMPYEPAHWDQMAALLDEEFSFRRSIVYRYKIAEVALMLLAIITLVQFLPLKKQTDRHTPAVAEQSSAPKADVSISIAATTPSQTEAAKNNTSNDLAVSSQASTSSLATVTQTAHQEGLLIHEKDKKSVLNNNQPIDAPLADSGIRDPLKKVPFSIGKVEYQNSSDFLANNVSENKPRSSTLPPPTTLKKYTPGLLLPFALKNVLHQLSANPQMVSEASKEIFYDCLLCKEGKRLVGLNVGMFGVKDYHIIFTPYDEIFSWASYTNVGKGYGGGLSLGITLGQRWEFQTGLIYSTKAYTPRTPAELYGNTVEGFVRESFGQFELDVLQIPFNIQYRLNKNSKWRFYTLGGASLNTVVQANYDRDVEAEGFIGLDGASGGRSFNLFRAQESDYITQKELNPGWFEGGSFKENSYLTFNTGFGLERLLTSRWSLFTEPSYRFHIFSFNKDLNIGPNHDRINSVFIKTGVKVNLH